MRLLLLLIIACVGAYYTVPTQAAHEQAAQEFLQTRDPTQNEGGFSLEDIVGYVRGLMVGQGRYESFYLVSKYSVDLPGPSFLECYGAFTLVRCSEVTPGGDEAPTQAAPAQ